MKMVFVKKMVLIDVMIAFIFLCQYSMALLDERVSIIVILVIFLTWIVQSPINEMVLMESSIVLTNIVTVSFILYIAFTIVIVVLMFLRSRNHFHNIVSLG